MQEKEGEKESCKTMERLKEYGKKITGRSLTEEQLRQFSTYYDMLIEKNKVMNLTAITERDEVELKHFIDSLALAGVYPPLSEGKLSVLDLGTGAGFPGIPLKIVFPELQMTLFDSLNKRILFLREVIEALFLTDCEAIHGRAEETARNKGFREQYDLVVSRAVANLAVLSEYCLPFVKPGGYFISYKQDAVEAELSEAERAITLLGGRMEAVEKLTLPDSDIGRSFVLIKKIKPTPKAYPRKAGTAKKNPL